TTSVAASRQTVESRPAPLWQRTYLDGICLALAGIVFWKTAASGYQIVLATEGVTSVSVDYTAFLAPLLLWVGAGLLTVRLGWLFLGHGRRVIEPLAAGLAGAVAPAVASSLSRQRHRVSAGIAFAALAIAFATSTALFNTTYEAQSRVDAELTNGADVTVTGSTSAAPGSILDKLKAIPGVVDAQAMQHRYAYVGTDLQDLYGIDPSTIGQATTMSNAFFQNGQAKATLAELARTPAGVLVSDETVNDFQLKQGDTLNLRMQDASGTYKVIPFVFAGVVREFPTAPRDSFIVANADYVAKMTGVATRETVLMRTQSDMAAVKSAAIRLVAGMPGTRVTDLGDAVHLIGSSLTAVDLNGLTTLELAFAVAMAAGSTGLVLALGLADRRRGFAILAVLGANARVLSAFIWAEALAVVIGGFVFGVATGWLVAQILVVVLQGVFDPPPEALAVPWPYLAGVVVSVVISTVLAISNALRETRVEPILRLRDMQ
ncbi:MAG: FtsX-like permease family protein, partial [Devosia sp.]